MHFDLAHAVATVVLIFIILWALERVGIKARREDGSRTWDWRMFAAIFAGMFVFNLVWPFS